MAAVEHMTIELTPEMADNLRSAVASGEYASTSEAIQHALRDWQERRELRGDIAGHVRASARDGIESGPSRHPTMDEVKAEERRRLQAIHPNR